MANLACRESVLANASPRPFEGHEIALLGRLNRLVERYYVRRDDDGVRRIAARITTLVDSCPAEDIAHIVARSEHSRELCDSRHALAVAHMAIDTRDLDARDLRLRMRAECNQRTRQGRPLSDRMRSTEPMTRFTPSTNQRISCWKLG